MRFGKRKRHPFDARTEMQLDNDSPAIGAWVAISAWSAAVIMGVFIFWNHPQSQGWFQVSHAQVENMEQDDSKPVRRKYSNQQSYNSDPEWDVDSPDFRQDKPKKRRKRREIPEWELDPSS